MSLIVLQCMMLYCGTMGGKWKNNNSNWRLRFEPSALGARVRELMDLAHGQCLFIDSLKWLQCFSSTEHFPISKTLKPSSHDEQGYFSKLRYHAGSSQSQQFPQRVVNMVVPSLIFIYSIILKFLFKRNWSWEGQRSCWSFILYHILLSYLVLKTEDW